MAKNIAHFQPNPHSNIPRDDDKVIYNLEIKTVCLFLKKQTDY